MLPRAGAEVAACPKCGMQQTFKRNLTALHATGTAQIELNRKMSLLKYFEALHWKGKGIGL